MAARIKEKRRRKRVDVALPIKIEYNKEKLITRTKNISVLGTYLEADKEIPIGTNLNIQVKIPKSKEIKCAGIIFRCQPSGSLEPKNQYGIGIFFRSFSGGGEKDLSKYIDYVLLQEKRKGKVYRRKKRKKQRKGGK